MCLLGVWHGHTRDLYECSNISKMTAPIAKIIVQLQICANFVNSNTQTFIMKMVYGIEQIYRNSQSEQVKGEKNRLQPN